MLLSFSSAITTGTTLTSSVQRLRMLNEEQRSRILAAIAIAVLVAVAGWAAYSGSLPQPPQQVEREGPPREQRSEKANQAISNEAGNSSTVSLQINCNPNCTANQTYKQSDDSALTRGIQKFTEDPIEAITTVIAIANGAFVILLLVQIADSRRSSERQLRAYVFVEKINIFPYPSGLDRISSVTLL
jgi:hypothetical protein